MIEGVARLHEMSLKRLAHTFYADLAVECDLEWSSKRQRQGDVVWRECADGRSVGNRIWRDLRVRLGGKPGEDDHATTPGHPEHAVRLVFEVAFTGGRMHAQDPVWNFATARLPNGVRAACSAEPGDGSRQTTNNGTAYFNSWLRSQRRWATEVA